MFQYIQLEDRGLHGYKDVELKVIDHIVGNVELGQMNY